MNHAAITSLCFHPLISTRAGLRIYKFQRIQDSTCNQYLSDSVIGLIKLFMPDGSFCHLISNLDCHSYPFQNSLSENLALHCLPDSSFVFDPENSKDITHEGSICVYIYTQRKKLSFKF